MGRDLHIEFWWGNLREGSHLEDPDAGERIILKSVFGKWAWTVSIWLMIWTGGGLL
jgi:hypothetical protein